jgi:hypothetical protein
MIERAGCYRRGPLPDMLEALAEALHVPVSELTREIPAKARRRA